MSDETKPAPTHEQARQLVREYVLGASAAAPPPLVNVIANGKRLQVRGPSVSYEQVVALVFKFLDPGQAPTLVWKAADGRGGTLTPGQFVNISDGMIFKCRAHGERVTEKDPPPARELPAIDWRGVESEPALFSPFGTIAMPREALALVLASLPADERERLFAPYLFDGTRRDAASIVEDDAVDADAERIFSMSDEELDAEIRASGRDPEKVNRWARSTGRLVTMLAKAYSEKRVETERAEQAEARLGRAMVVVDWVVGLATREAGHGALRAVLRENGFLS